MNRFGIILRDLRESNGLTQAELAEMLGVSTSAVGMYEQGRRSPDRNILVKISYLFAVSTDYLLGAVQDGPYEIEHLLLSIKDKIPFNQGILYNGVLLDKEETERLFDTMLVTLRAVLNTNHSLKTN